MHRLHLLREVQRPVMGGVVVIWVAGIATASTPQRHSGTQACMQGVV